MTEIDYESEFVSVQIEKTAHIKITLKVDKIQCDCAIMRKRKRKKRFLFVFNDLMIDGVDIIE